MQFPSHYGPPTTDVEKTLFCCIGNAVQLTFIQLFIRVYYPILRVHGNLNARKNAFAREVSFQKEMEASERVHVERPIKRRMCGSGGTDGKRSKSCGSNGRL